MVQGWIQIIVFCPVLTACVPLLGGYMARVFTNERVFLTPVLGPLERLIYRRPARRHDALAGLEGLRRLAAGLLRRCSGSRCT